MFLGRIQCCAILIICTIIKNIETRTYKYTKNGLYEILPEKYTPASKFQNIINGLWRGLNTNIYFNEDDVETIYDPNEHRRSSVMINDIYLLPLKSTDSNANALVPNYNKMHNKNFLRELSKSSIAQAKEYYKLYKNWKSIRSEYPNVFKYMSKANENDNTDTPHGIYHGTVSENNPPNNQQTITNPFIYPQLSDQNSLNLYNFYSGYNSNIINKNIDDDSEKVHNTNNVREMEIIHTDTEMKNKTVTTNTFRNIDRDNLYLKATHGSNNHISNMEVGNGANETAVNQFTERNVNKVDNHVHTNFIVNVVSDQKLKNDDGKNTNLQYYGNQDTNKLYKVHEVISNATGTLNINNTAKNMTFSLFRELQPEKYYHTNDIQVLGLDKGNKDKIGMETIVTTDSNQITKLKKNYDALLVPYNVDKNPFHNETQGVTFNNFRETIPTKVSAIANENITPPYYGNKGIEQMRIHTNGNTSAMGNGVLDESARDVIDFAEFKVQVTTEQNIKLSHHENINVENLQIGNFDPHYKAKDYQYRIADNIAINPLKQIVKANHYYGNHDSTKYFDKHVINTGARENSMKILEVPSHKYVNLKYRFNTTPKKMHDDYYGYPNKGSKYIAQLYRVPINHNKTLLKKVNPAINLHMKFFNNKNNIGKMTANKNYREIMDVTSFTKPDNKYFYQPASDIKDVQNIHLHNHFYNRNKFGPSNPQRGATEVNIKSSRLPPQESNNFNKQGTTAVLNPYRNTNNMHLQHRNINSGRVNKFTIPKSRDITNIQSTYNNNNNFYHRGNKYIGKNAKNKAIKSIGMTSNKNINNSLQGSKINENLSYNRINNIVGKHDYHTQERVNTRNRYKGLADSKKFHIYGHEINSNNIRGISHSNSNNLPKYGSVIKNGQEPILSKSINENGKLTYLNNRDIETFNNIAEIVKANNVKTSMNKYKVRNNRNYNSLLYRDGEKVEGINSNHTENTVSSFDIPTNIEENVNNINFDYYDSGKKISDNSYNNEQKLLNRRPAETTFNENINFEDNIETNYDQSSGSNTDNKAQEFANNIFTISNKNHLNIAYLSDNQYSTQGYTYKNNYYDENQSESKNMGNVISRSQARGQHFNDFRQLNSDNVKYLKNYIEESSTRYTLRESSDPQYPSNKNINFLYHNSYEDTNSIETLSGLSKFKEKSHYIFETTTDQYGTHGSHEYTYENNYYDQNNSESKNMGYSVSHSQARGKNFNDLRQLNSDHFEIDTNSGNVYDGRYGIYYLKGKRKIVTRAKDTSNDFIEFSEEELNPPHRGNIRDIKTRNFYKMFNNNVKKIHRDNYYTNHSNIMNNEKKSDLKFHPRQNIIHDESLKKIFNNSYDSNFENLHEYNGNIDNYLKHDINIAVKDNDFNVFRLSTAKDINITNHDEKKIDNLQGTTNKNVSNYGKLSSDISFIDDVPTLAKSKNMILPGKHLTIKDMKYFNSSKQNKKGIMTVVSNTASKYDDTNTINVSQIDFNKTHSANKLDSVKYGKEDAIYVLAVTTDKNVNITYKNDSRFKSTNSLGQVQQQKLSTNDPLSSLKLSLNVTYHGHKNKKNSSAGTRKDGVNSYNISTESNLHFFNRTHNISEINANHLDDLDLDPNLDHDSTNNFSFYNATNKIDSNTMASLGKNTVDNIYIFSTNKNNNQPYQGIPDFKNISASENPEIVKEIKLGNNNTLTTTTEKNWPHQNVKYLNTTSNLIETNKTNEVNATKAFEIASDSKGNINNVNYGTLDNRNNKTTHDTNKDREANPYTINDDNKESNITTEYRDRDINTQTELDARNKSDTINETIVTTDKYLDYNNYLKDRNNSQYKLDTRIKVDTMNETIVTTDKDLDYRNAIHDRDNSQYNETSRRNNAVINFNDVVNEILGLFKKSFEEIIQKRNKL